MGVGVAAAAGTPAGGQPTSCHIAVGELPPHVPLLPEPKLPLHELHPFPEPEVGGPVAGVAVVVRGAFRGVGLAGLLLLFPLGAARTLKYYRAN